MEQKKTGDTITDADYTTGVKGIEGALAHHADEILMTKCGSEEQQKEVLALMTRLVHISDSASPETDTRVRYPITDADYLIIKPFVDAHLLITSNDGTIINNKAQAAGTTRIIEVAHEALIRHWPKLQKALKDRQFVLWRERLHTALTEWQSNKDSELLLVGQRLVDAKRWLKFKKDELNEQEQTFIRCSISHLRWAKLRTLSLIVVPLALVVAFFIWSSNNGFSPKVGWYVLLAKAGIYTLQPEMVAIPPGKDCQKQTCEFLMGPTESDPQADKSEKPQHPVHFNKAFKIGRYEVTFDEYQVFAFLIARDGGCKNMNEDQHPYVINLIDDSIMGKGQRPVINVSWNDAQCYAQWLSWKTGKNYHLPTEAQWEYAARADTTSDYYWGNGDIKYVRLVFRKFRKKPTR